MSGVNDENVQPERPNVLNGQPNDHDRKRFGFKNPKSQKPATGAAPTPSLKCPTAHASAVAGRGPLQSSAQALEFSPSKGTATADTSANQSMAESGSQLPPLPVPLSVDFVALCEEHLQPDGLSALLKIKTVSDKYEWKDRMAELENINLKLKEGLKDQRQRTKELRSELESEQEKVKAWMSDAHSMMDSQSKEASSQQEALRQQSQEDQEKLRQQLRREQDAARKESEEKQTAMRKRLEAAETTLSEREAALQKEKSAHQQSQSKVKELEEKFNESQRQFKKMEELVQISESNAKEKHDVLERNFAKDKQQQVDMARKRECELLTDLESCVTKRTTLEEQIKEQEQQLTANRAELEECAKRHREQVGQLQVEQQRVRKIEEEHSQQLQKLNSDHNEQLLHEQQRRSNLESDHSQQLQKLRSEHGDQLLLEKQKAQKLEQDHIEQLQKIKSEHGEQFSSEQQKAKKLEEDLMQQMQKMQAEHAEQLQLEQERGQRLNREHGEQLQQLQREHSDQQLSDQQKIQRLECSHMEHLQRLEREHSERLQQVQRDHSEQQQLDQQRLEQTHAEEMQTERQRFEKSHSDLVESRQTNAELRSQLHTAESERDRLATLVQESQAEVDARRDSASQANATHQGLVKAHTALKCEHEKLSELANERHSTIAVLEDKLQEAERQLLSKDAEFREQIRQEQQKNQKMEHAHSEQLQLAESEHAEQLRIKQQEAQKLENAQKEQLQRLESHHLEQLRAKQQDVEKLEHAHREQLQRLESEHAEQLNIKQQDAEKTVQAHKDQLQRLESERREQLLTKQQESDKTNDSHKEQLQQLASEHAAELRIKQQEADKASHSHKEQLQQLASEHAAELRLKQQEADKTSHSHKEQLQQLASEHAAELRLKQQEVQKLEWTHCQQMQNVQSDCSEQLRLEQQKTQQLESSHKEQLRKAQLEHTEMLRLEQERAQKLQKEHANQLEQIKRSHGDQHQQAQHRLNELESSHSDQLQSNAQLQALLQSTESERDQLSSSLAECQVALSTQMEAATQAAAMQQSLREELAGVRGALEVKSEQATSLAHEKHVMELEFRSYREHHGSSNQQQMEAITELKLTVDKLSQKVESTQLELGVQQGNMMQQQTYVKSLERQLSQAEKSRRDLHNAIQELKGNIRVFCRIRPALPAMEVALQSSDAANKLSLSYGGESYNFAFDNIFGATTTQADIFDEVTGLVQSALDGYKVCIFAYGQTGSGKTFTMQGTEERQTWGLIPRSLQQIFQASEAMRVQGWTWELQASFLEVYNETIRDLLRPGSGYTPEAGAVGGQHVIKHDDAYGTMVTNVTSVEVDSMAQISSLMARAATQRAVGSTDMNAVSSRSHSIFALYLKGVNMELDSELHGALHLVDLAGSERLSKSGATGDRLKETQNINKSLSSLADVFLAKAEGRTHVPFRNSKLTHLMEPCLSGQGKTMMMVNVGPEESNAHETLCSLRFASQVSQCDTGGKPKRTAKSANQSSSSKRPPTSTTRPASALTASTASSSARSRTR